MNRIHVLFLTALLLIVSGGSLAGQDNGSGVAEIVRTGDTMVEVHYANGQKRILDFYDFSLVRIFQDPSDGMVRDPKAYPEAKILTDDAHLPLRCRLQKQANTLSDSLKIDGLTVTTGKQTVSFDAETGLMSVSDEKGLIVREIAPVAFDSRHITLHLSMNEGECFYGGGMQNGRFSHAGKVIQIVNTNNWTDGGVASPAPFYWSSAGYSILFHTFAPGRYDFGADRPGEVQLRHDTDYLDIFLSSNRASDTFLLNDYYQLTGFPVLLPKFGFYEGHLNAYNRDYWTETEEGGVLFEDGKRYKESQKKNDGIQESLNGELVDSAGRSNHMFSARAVIDRYAAHDMPLGWILPNDGYGAGYGQTGSVDGNIDNLRRFGDYAREHGVELGLWTQSDLHPKEGVEPLLQRDIVREVAEAGVRVLKTDVAWVGAGYSFGLNGVTDVAQIMTEKGNNARPFIITLDGWAGTQRYAGVWSGDQTGGQWEYIRFHIPTYIGSGLSGQPNVGSDMDGIFGGKNLPVNVRDFQWKTFTPMELNMDGWGANEKYPHALGEKAANINRKWLKLKSMLMPYTYSIAKQSSEAYDCMPMVRAMSLEMQRCSGEKLANRQQIDDLTKYQFMYGPYLLVAPVYQDTKMEEEGNDIRNGIYLPAGLWLDPYANAFVEGGRILNSYDTPLDRIPVFVKEGSVIPYTAPHNQPRDVDSSVRCYEIVPGSFSFREYDDDGVTQAYLNGDGVATLLEGVVEGGVFAFRMNKSTGSFKGFQPRKRTTLRIHTGVKPRGVAVRDAETKKSVYPKWKFSEGILVINIPEVDVTKKALQVIIDGFVSEPMLSLATKNGHLDVPSVTCETTAYSVTPRWQHTEITDYAEILFEGMLYTTLREGEYLFDGLKPETTYDFRLRVVNADGASEWIPFSATTDANPLEFAVQGIQGTTTCKNQGGQGINRFFDFDESTVWHTAWSEKAVPFTINLDLNCTVELDKLQYLPREDAGNGTLLEGTVSYSPDGKNWSDVTPFEWAADNTTKEHTFTDNPKVRYIRMDVTRGRGDFGSGRQLYVFRKPGTDVMLPGDINRDGKVDMEDLTSYMNYTGLRSGDPDFDGYVSVGDVDYDGRIDAFDISVVATQLRGGAEQRVEHFGGMLRIEATSGTGIAKKLKMGEELDINVTGVGLEGVNAFSLALPYNAADLEFMEAVPREVKEMENLTHDRLHANGEKVLYPTFVNVGDCEPLSGDGVLCTLRFRARRACTVNMKAENICLVSKTLEVREQE
jgi:hypothetical protein